MVSKTSNLLKKYKLISEQVNQYKIKIILQILEQTIKAGIEGDVTEFGCYIGTTSLFLQRLLIDSNKKLFVYDSFQGLPVKNNEDLSAAGTQFKAGELAITKKDLIFEFKKSNLPIPIIKKGWFKDLENKDIPRLISLAFLDGDFYNSILDSLNLVWPNLNKNGVIIIDDYSNLALPGVVRACNLFFKHKNGQFIFNINSGLGIFTKL